MCRNIITENLDEYQIFQDISLQGDIKTFLFILLKGNIWRMKENYSVYRLVREQNGNSWTSRALSEKGRYRKQRNGVRCLEKATKESFGIRINFQKRKQQLAFNDIIVDRHILKMIKKAVYYVFMQRGMAFVLICKIFGNWKSRILKNKI